MLSVIKSRTETVQAELDRLRSDRAKKALVPATGNIRPMFEDASLEWRAAVIKLLVSKVVIHPSGQVTKLWRGRRFDPESVTIDWIC
jgi:hypothetical protein